MDDDPTSLEARLSHEVTQLSTNLVTAVAKQLELEEKVLQVLRDNFQLRQLVEYLKQFEQKYQELQSDYERLRSLFVQDRKAKDVAETENKRLQGEVEDLTASLFNEANLMVSNASRETYNFKIKNRKLNETITEKDSIIESLQEQLKDLKDKFFRMEDQQKSSSQAGTPKLEQSRFGNNPSENSVENLKEGSGTFDQYESIIFSPTVKAIRLDLPNYNDDFMNFIYTIVDPSFTFDLNSLKTLRFFRRIWTDELENSFPTIPNLTNSNFINRWQRGKTFWNFLVEGKLVIEPIRGINETFKLMYKGEKIRKDHPVALRDPCAFCGESKEDMLEHCRLYSLKFINTDHNSLASGDNHEPIASYPLCNYCLIKLRNICDFFAKLRLLHANVYKLQPRREYYEHFNSNIQLVKSFGSSSETETKSGNTRESEVTISSKVQSGIEQFKLIKIYYLLVFLRCKIFWSKIGYWDNDEFLYETNIENLSYDPDNFLSSTKVRSSYSRPSGVSIPKAGEENQPSDINLNSNSQEEMKIETDSSRKILSPTKTVDSQTPQNVSATDEGAPERIANEKENDGSNSDTEGFSDTLDSFKSDAPNKEALGRDISRKHSKSQKFKKKMNQDLDQTLNMLENSMINE